MKEEQKSMNQAQSTLMDTSSVLKIRLDANEVLERYRVYITGKVRSVVYDGTGKPFVEEKVIAPPKANDKGIHWLVNFMENIVNPQAVQGNLDYDQYQNYIEEVHDSLLSNVMNNLVVWGIDEDDYEPICDTTMNIIQLFISRLIDNKERDSYAQSIQVRETSNVMASKGLFK